MMDHGVAMKRHVKVSKHMYNSNSRLFLYINAHLLLNLLTQLGKSDKMQNLLSILSLFLNDLSKFNNREYKNLS